MIIILAILFAALKYYKVAVYTQSFTCWCSQVEFHHLQNDMGIKNLSWVCKFRFVQVGIIAYTLPRSNLWLLIVICKVLTTEVRLFNFQPWWSTMEGCLYTSGLLCFPWYAYRRVQHSEGQHSQQLSQHTWGEDCPKLTIVSWHIFLFVLKRKSSSLYSCWNFMLTKITWLTCFCRLLLWMQ